MNLPNIYGSFAIEREETQKKINFIFICQKCFKYESFAIEREETPKKIKNKLI